MITTLAIDGMTCNNCVHHVGEALRGVSGVRSVEVSLPESLATVDHDDVTTLPALIAAVEEAGYTAAAPKG
ncbi:MAG: heavy metal-associated domain-containing protein [Kofleriaceae bacterium]